MKAEEGGGRQDRVQRDIRMRTYRPPAPAPAGGTRERQRACRTEPESEQATRTNARGTGATHVSVHAAACGELRGGCSCTRAGRCTGR